MIITLIAVYWIASSTFSYYLARRDYLRSEYLKWDNFSRYMNLAMAVLFGTYYWLLLLALNGIVRIADSDWGKREVKW